MRWEMGCFCWFGPGTALPRGGGGREKREKEKGGGKKKKGGKGKKINSVSLYVF